MVGKGNGHGSVDLRGDETKVSKERRTEREGGREEASGGSGVARERWKKRPSGARAFCNFYNLNCAAAGVAGNCSNPEKRVSLRVYF